jgi:hypothetical protein
MVAPRSIRSALNVLYLVSRESATLIGKIGVVVPEGSLTTEKGKSDRIRREKSAQVWSSY